MTGAPGGPARRRAGPSDEGVTLVETMVTCVVVSLALAATVPVVTTFYRESTAVQRTYGAVDQVLLASEILNQYIREAVEPAPPVGGVPVPPFALATAAAATFYADTGEATGPQKIVAQVTSASGVSTFTVTGTPADANSCPMTGSPGTACTYLHSASHYIAKITNLANGATPVFTYTMTGGSTTAPSTTCVAGAGNCPLDQISAVAVVVQAKNVSGDMAGYQSLAYLFAPDYNASVG